MHLLGLKKISLKFILRTREKQTSNLVAVNYKLPDKPYDHCGLAGVWAGPKVNVTNIVIEMCKALQHRGHNGGGVAVKPSGRMLKVYKKARAFNEIFRSVNVVEENSLRGEVAF